MPDWAQWVSFVLGTVGAVLGVISTWAGLTRDRPRIRVRAVVVAERNFGSMQGFYVAKTPDAAQDVLDGKLGIELVNPGYVAVRIREVGVCPGRFLWWHRFRQFPYPAGRHSILEDASGKVRLPHELAPGAVARLTFDKSATDSPFVGKARSVYALTEDERLFYGRSALLRFMAQKARGLTEPVP